ncbi:MAG: glycosyltransferase family 39 protein [Patescibacteria group bacterium]
MKNLLVVVIFLGAFFVRFWKIEYIPFPDDADELAHIYAGQSLFQYGKPISWSSFKAINGVWQKVTLRPDTISSPISLELSQPWFDHTPFLSVLYGAITTFFGYDFLETPPAILYRLPMLLVSIYSLLLIFVIAKEIFDYKAALLALVLFAFSPTIVIGQRMLIPENILAALFLTTFYLLLKKESIFYLIVVGILAGITKITGLIIVPIVIFYFLQKKDFKKAIIYLLSTLTLTGAILLFYGYSVDFESFVKAFTNQSFRLVGWANPTFILSSAGFQNFIMLDLSYFVIIFAGLHVFMLNKKTDLSKLLSFAIMACLATIWATSAEQDMLGWYKLPLFAFLGLSSASFIKEKNYSLLAILLSLTIITNLGIVRFPTHPLPETIVLRFVIGLFLLFCSVMIFLVSSTKKQLLIIVTLLMIYVGQSFYITHTYFKAKCTDRICPTPVVTSTSTIKNFLNK